MKSMFACLCLAVLAMPLVAEAGHDGCCPHCGCHAHLKKVCRPVCEMKEVKETVYSCECEDFCIPGPSKKCKQPCHDGCGCETVEVPTCATVRTRKKLLKKEEVKKVPSYKWVVEYVCEGCSGGCSTDGCHRLLSEGLNAVDEMPGAPAMDLPVVPEAPLEGEDLPPAPPREAGLRSRARN